LLLVWISPQTSAAKVRIISETKKKRQGKLKNGWSYLEDKGKVSIFAS